MATIPLSMSAFETEACVNQREVLRWRIEGKPDAFKAVRRGQEFIFGDVFVVVPDETGVPGGGVGEEAIMPPLRGGGDDPPEVLAGAADASGV